MNSLLLGAAAPWRFEHPAVLIALLLVPVVVLHLWLAFARQRKALRSFAGDTPQASRPAGWRMSVRLLLIACGLTSLIISLARPQADPIEETVTVRGRDLVFVVDVSKSMLSRDVVPDRLSRTKLWINDLVNTLQGDRVGLVAFAGVPVVKCPLTLDQGFFRMELDELSPASVPRGGTLIGDAVRKTMNDVFEPGQGRFRDIILITDGEDQGSFPIEAARAAGEAGIRIIAIGIGSELQGVTVPSDASKPESFIEYEGTRVTSKLDSTTLASVAEAARRSGGGGVFLNVGTGTMDLDKVYHDLIASAEQRETDNKTSVTYRELFPWFLALSLICLMLEPLISVRVKLRGSASAAPLAACLAMAIYLPQARAEDDAATAASTTAAKSTTAATTQAAAPLTAADRYNAGRTLFLDGKLQQAADLFREADRLATDTALSNKARFNLGLSLLKQATSPPPAPASGPDAPSTPETPKPLNLLDQAARAFRSALAADPSDEQAAKNVEIVRRLMQDLRDKEQQQQQKNDQNSPQTKDQKDDSAQDGKNSNGKEPSAKQQAQKHQQNAEDLKKLSQQQQQAADASKQAQDQNEQRDRKTAESKQKQEQVDRQTKSEQQKARQADATKQKIDEARKEQEAANKALESNDPKQAQEHQAQAARLLEEAARSEAQAAEQAREQAKKEAPKYDEQASQILDKERKQREARQQMLRALRGKPQPVEKDW